jgi:ABC-2 type transport system permease protein
MQSRLFLASIKMLYRDKQTLFWAMAFPVIFAVVFGLFDFSETPALEIRVVSASGSRVARAVATGLRRSGSFTVHETSDLRGSLRLLEDDRLDMVVAVPDMRARVQGAVPDSPAHMNVYYNGANAAEARVGLDAVGRITQSLNLRLAGVTVPSVEMQPRAVAGKSVDYYDFLLPGLVAMGVMNFSIIGMSVAIARFREQRILKRILATPLPPVKFLSAQVGARLLLSLVQAALILAVGVYGFGAHVYGNVVWLFVFALLANVVFLNFGFAVAGRSPNPDAAQGTANAVALPMMFLSGVFFPTDTLPPVMQAIVKFLPLTPLIDAMRKVSVEGSSITETGPQMLLLAVWVVASFVIAARFFRFAET